MRRGVTLLGLLAFVSFGVSAQQGLVSDVLAGKLVKPKVGQWAWYELRDQVSGQRFVLRQAIVGEEKVGRKNGYWVELEVIPPVGYTVVYKMLLTGPASDPKHMHRLIVRDGLAGPQEITVAAEPEEQSEKPPKPKRKSLGMEEIETEGGVVRAEHLVVTTGGRTSEMWVNDEVRPMGIVRMVSPDGELLLRSYGEGGEEARSVINDDPLARNDGSVPKSKIEVRVEGGAQGAPDVGEGDREIGR